MMVAFSPEEVANGSVPLVRVLTVDSEMAQDSCL